jgi:membrane protein involved in colicin uptake
MKKEQEEMKRKVFDERVRILQQYGCTVNASYLLDLSPEAFTILRDEQRIIFEAAESERKVKEEAERIQRESIEAQRIENERLRKELEAQKSAQEQAQKKIEDEARMAKYKEEAEAKAKIDAELKVKRDAEIAERQAKEEMERLEKKRKFQKFLDDNSYNPASDHYETKEGKTRLYRLIAIYE